MNPNDPASNPQPYVPPVNQPVGPIPAGPMSQSNPNPAVPPQFQPQNVIQNQQYGPPPPSFQTTVPPPPPPQPAIIPGQSFLNSAAPPPMPPNPSNSYSNPGLPPVNNNFPTQPPALNIRQDVIGHLKKANNVLVTVSNNPSVDQLSSAIGITLILNKLGKHATAVYSGKTPATLAFLQPEKTIEKNTDSLRDFIIALDKAKADKLRYKVEDKFVKIFITPYHTSLSEDDLEFSQGDFNVDVILALGVHRKDELDQAITAHGRILHDSVTISVNNKQTSDIGNINWLQADASSLAEMLVGLIEPLQGDKALLDSQIATSFLTGVVAETDRFSNEKTTSLTMNVSATLMKAGANQQLVATKLEEPEAPPVEEKKEEIKIDKDDTGAVPIPTKDGSLEIDHNKPPSNVPKAKSLAEIEKEINSNKDSFDSDEDSNLAKIHIDDQGKLLSEEEVKKSQEEASGAAAPVTEPTPPRSSNMIFEPPSLGGEMSSIARDEDDIPAIEAVDEPAESHLSHGRAKTIELLDQDNQEKTLTDIEKSVDSSHVDGPSDAKDEAEVARAAVEKAKAFDNSQRLEPIKALNATPIDLESEDKPSGDITNEEVFPPQLIGPDKGPGPDPTASPSDTPGAPPPVPPPLIPPTS